MRGVTRTSIHIAHFDVTPHRTMQLTSTRQTSRAQIASSYLRGPPPRFWTCAQITADYLRTADGSRRRKSRRPKSDATGLTSNRQGPIAVTRYPTGLGARIVKQPPCKVGPIVHEFKATFGRPKLTCRMGRAQRSPPHAGSTPCPRPSQPTVRPLHSAPACSPFPLSPFPSSRALPSRPAVRHTAGSPLSRVAGRNIPPA